MALDSHLSIDDLFLHARQLILYCIYNPMIRKYNTIRFYSVKTDQG